jgi:dipeptidyl aminopeptidase/acylaminoacyl peptidase
MNFLNRAVRRCALVFGVSVASGLWGSGAAQAQVITPAVAGPTIPVADFFKPPLAASPRLSPNGRYLAFALTQGSARTMLAVQDLEQGGPPKAVGAFPDNDINRIWWINDERLVFDAFDRDPPRDRPVRPGLWAVNRDGSDFRQLIRADYREIQRTGSRVLGKERVLGWDWGFYQTLADGSSDVVVGNFQFNSLWEVVSIALSRLDTRTGLTTPLTDGAPPNVIQWAVDPRGNPRVATSEAAGRYTSYRREGEAWVKWQEGDPVRSSAPDVVAIGASGELFIVMASPQGTSALFRVDPSNPSATPDLLLSLEGYDFTGQVLLSQDAKRLLGLHFETDAKGSTWFDAGLKEVQKQVDAQLPNKVNRLLCDRCEAAPRVLVAAESDIQPVEYYLYQRATQRLTPLFASRPWLRGKTMGQRDVHRFKARDGLSIPTLVTLPAGKNDTPKPAVVLVHGGPWVRGTHWAWEPEAQFLASRGYVVIEPEFRGSAGYGHPHFKAGWKQWGLAMQDDLADAVDWAVKQGWVDAKRVCIAGASYGGYAALMGVARHPEHYRCAVNWAGVTDIDLMYSIHWSDFSGDWKQYGMPTLIGDRSKDAAQLKATSPISQAAKIQRPLLMAYGTDDYRVPIKHGTEFKAVVSKTNPDVEWVVYADEGHGWRKLQTNVDFWGRVEKFLDRHIGAGAAAAGDAKK